MIKLGDRVVRETSMNSFEKAVVVKEKYELNFIVSVLFVDLLAAQLVE